MAERAAKSLMIQFKSSVGLGSSNSAGDGHTDHRVVAGTDQTHHLDVSRDGGGASELGITVHTAHGVFCLCGYLQFTPMKRYEFFCDTIFYNLLNIKVP